MAFQFLSLPAELRNNIYEHISLNEGKPWSYERQQTPAMLLTNRQIYKEPIKIHRSSVKSTLSNIFAMARQLVIPPDVLRIFARHVIEGRSYFA